MFCIIMLNFVEIDHAVKEITIFRILLAVPASKFGVKLYAFADDNQLHVHFDISDIISSVIAQALTKDISTPSDIAPSALETIIFYCFMGHISALTYYLSLLLLKCKNSLNDSA